MKNFLKLFTGFSIIGVINTTIHSVIVITFVEIFQINPVFANICGFLTANIFSFFANSKWNFKSDISGKRYFKFLVVSLSGLIITILISYTVNLMQLHYLIGLLIIYITLPLINFTLHYNITWKNNK